MNQSLLNQRIQDVKDMFHDLPADQIKANVLQLINKYPFMDKKRNDYVEFKHGGGSFDMRDGRVLPF